MKVHANAKMKDIAQHSIPTGGVKTLPNSPSGLSIDCGFGGQTNTAFGVQVSKRGAKDAWNPSGPGGGK